MKNNPLMLILVVVVVLAGVMIAITYSVPEVKQFAAKVAAHRNLPIWLVGLAAPIVFFLRKLNEWIQSLGKAAPSVLRENATLRSEQETIRRELDSLLQWRSQSLQTEYDKVSRHQTDITTLQKQISTLNRAVEIAKAKTVDAYAQDVTSEQKENVFSSVFTRN